MSMMKNVGNSWDEEQLEMNKYVLHESSTYKDSGGARLRNYWARWESREKVCIYYSLIILPVVKCCLIVCYHYSNFFRCGYASIDVTKVCMLVQPWALRGGIERASPNWESIR